MSPLSIAEPDEGAESRRAAAAKDERLALLAAQI